MADPKADLPEGTDTVINGAMQTTPVADSTDNSAAPRSAGGSAGSASAGTGRLMDKVRDSGGKLSTQAADKARGLVGQGLERSAEALANVSKLVGETAGGIDDRLGAEYGDYARRAASSIESAANSLASKDPDELVDDTRQFIRKSPGIALAGAAIAGFALARLIKSGLSSDEDDRETTKRG